MSQLGLNLRSHVASTRVVLGLLLLASGALGGCGGGSGGIYVVDVAILQGGVNVKGGASATSTKLDLLLTFADGSTGPGGGFSWALPVWSSDDPGTASVGLDGTVTGVAVGRTTIRASLGGLQASVPANVSVVPEATLARVPVSDVGTALVLGNASTPSNTARCICIDDLGRIHITWFDPVNGLRYARSLDGGVSFQPSVGLVSAVDAPVPGPLIACGQEGQDDVYVVYADAANAVRCLGSPDAGTTWPAVGVVTGLPNDAFFRRSAAVRGQTVMIFTIVGSTLVRSADAGQTFGVPVPNVHSVPDSGFCDVLMDPRNLSKVVTVGDDPFIRMRVSDDDGVSFGAQVSGPAIDYSDCAIDQLGNVFCVGNDAIWAIIPVDAPAVLPLPSALPGGNSRSVAVDGLNIVHMVRNDAGSIRLLTSSDLGLTLDPEELLDTTASFPTCAGSWSFAGVGVVYLRGGSVFYMHN